MIENFIIRFNIVVYKMIEDFSIRFNEFYLYKQAFAEPKSKQPVYIDQAFFLQSKIGSLR